MDADIDITAASCQIYAHGPTMEIHGVQHRRGYLLRVQWSRIMISVTAQPKQEPIPNKGDWVTPWQFCKECDDYDRSERRARKDKRSPTEFDGNRPYDSPIIYWSRRVHRRVHALTPAAQFVYLCAKRLSGPPSARTWMWQWRAVYYAEDYYVLLMTVFVALWSCLTIGLTRPSSWQAATLAWVLLVPLVLLLPAYFMASSRRLINFVVDGIILVVLVAFPAVLGLESWVRWAVPWPLILRAVEIMLTLARFVSFDALQRGYNQTSVSRARYLCYTILYFIQICFIYATIYAFWVPGGFRNLADCTSGSAGTCATVIGLNNYVYLSVTTATTLGGSFQPGSGLAQWLQISEVASGILLLAVGVAAFVGKIFSEPLARTKVPDITRAEADPKTD